MTKDKVKIALVQMSSKREDKMKNIKIIEQRTIEAKEQGAELVVFPELALTGYVIRDQLYEMAELVPGPATRQVGKIAKETGASIIFGMPEISEKTRATLFNTSVFVAPEGLIGKYRKMYLPTHSVFEEKRYFRPGYQAPVFDTKFGKIGLCICYDIYFPEVIRLLRLKGAQLIICISASPATRRCFFETLITARAIENSAFIVYVNLVGVEEGLHFWGGSRLVNPIGNIVAKGKYDENDLVVCEVNFQEIVPAETFIPVLRDLRPELFDLLKKNAELL